MFTRVSFSDVKSVEDRIHLQYEVIMSQLADFRHELGYYRLQLDAEVAVIRTLELVIKRLTAVQPCIAFADRFGWILHEQYREKFPINFETKVEDVYTDVTGQYTLSAIIEPVGSYDSNTPVEFGMHHLFFENWKATKRSSVHRLAYFPPNNTVFCDMARFSYA